MVSQLYVLYVQPWCDPNTVDNIKIALASTGFSRASLMFLNSCPFRFSLSFPILQNFGWLTDCGQSSLLYLAQPNLVMEDLRAAPIGQGCVCRKHRHGLPPLSCLPDVPALLVARPARKHLTQKRHQAHPFEERERDRKSWCKFKQINLSTLTLIKYALPAFRDTPARFAARR